MKKIKIILFVLFMLGSTSIHALVFTANIRAPRFYAPITEEAEQNKKDTIIDLYNTIIFNKEMVVLQNEKRNNDVMYLSTCRDKFQGNC